MSAALGQPLRAAVGGPVRKPAARKHLGRPVFVHGLLGLALWGDGAAASPNLPTVSAPFQACGVSIDSVPGLTWQVQEPSEPGVCTMVAKGGPAQPFTSVVSVLPWATLGPARKSMDVGFFHLSRDRTMRYRGRPSYEHPRFGHAQRVLQRPVVSTQVSRGLRRMSARSDLQVSWLKPVDTGTLDEADERFVCHDHAVSDGWRVAIVNWCVAKDAPNAEQARVTAGSLRLVSP